MISMEIAMNTVDYLITGGAIINVYVISMLLAGFFTPLPYNYYRLKNIIKPVINISLIIYF